MGCPKGFPQGLDFAGGGIVTVVLRDWHTLTGRFLGCFEDRKYYDDCDDYDEDEKKPSHDDKHCKPAKVDLKVDVEEDPVFCLLQLTVPAGVVSLDSVTLVGVTPVLGVTTATFPSDAIVAVNVENIIWAGTGATVTPITITL